MCKSPTPYDPFRGVFLGKSRLVALVKRIEFTSTFVWRKRENIKRYCARTLFKKGSMRPRMMPPISLARWYTTTRKWGQGHVLAYARCRFL